MSTLKELGGEIVMQLGVCNSADTTLRVKKFPELGAWRKYRAADQRQLFLRVGDNYN